MWLPFIAVFLLTCIIGYFAIPVLTRLKFGQTIRDDGPSTHLSKMGIPTMGGIIFLVPVTVFSLLYYLFDPRILGLVLVILAFGLVGFIDDYIKVAKKRKDGLYAGQKLVGLIIISTAFAFYAKNVVGTDILIPFTNQYWDLSWAFIPFAIFVLISSTNAVNLTDGIDGLAAGITLIILAFFAIIATNIYNTAHVAIFCIYLAAGCLGFLVFNWHPAKVIMGDTGSIALGGAVSAISIMLKMPLFLVIVGIIYVIETLSVAIQVLYFKKTGKRVFKMAPMHHHFELSGWKETKVVTAFCSVTLFVCIAMLFMYYNF